MSTLFGVSICLAWSSIVDASGHPLSDRGQRNIETVARLVGIVQHFHPSDEAASVDWFALTSDALPRIEAAADDADLIAIMQDLFTPIARSVRIGHVAFVEEDATLGPRATAASEDSVRGIIGWRHRGYGQGQESPNNIYASQRVRDVIAHADDPEDILPLGAAYRAKLSSGVFCDVPLTLCYDGTHTLPRGRDVVHEPADPDSRAGRLANVILTWNIFRHFYPYFDVIDADWDTVLTQSLQRAATDANQREFLDTLRTMVAELDDGHGNVFLPGMFPARRLPLDWDWARDGHADEFVLVATHVPDQKSVEVRRGDIVQAINGEPMTHVIEARRALISAANDGWLRYRLRQDLVMTDAEQMILDMERPDGTAYTAIVPTVPMQQFDYTEPKREMVETVEPGVMYVDFARLKDGGEFAEVLPQLREAEAIIADLRGYPGQAFLTFLHYIAPEPVRSANWNIPVYLRPNQQDVEWETSFWWPNRFEPQLETPVVFITNGSAISYAESCMAIVEQYKLGEIVGEPTAGTNGNVNPLTLPGGYRIMWTGMKVTKHDDSVHHGVGVKPTIAVDRTGAGIAAGKDELFDAALKRARESVATPATASP